MSTESMVLGYRDKIIIFYKQNGRMPSFSELQQLTHYRSKVWVSNLIDKLESMNFLRRDHMGKLIPSYNYLSVPFPGLVQAGFPSPADSGFVEESRLDLYSYLVKNPSDTFIHEVTGDSMIEAGIFEGDLIISERSDAAKINQIVIAEVGGDLTVKRYLVDSNGVGYLHPENPNHRDIYPDEDNDIKILAIVRSVIRSFLK